MQLLLTRRRAAAAAAMAVGLPLPGQGAAARRIVAVGGSLTETLYALGAEDELVGVDTTSLYPPAAQRLPSVGYARALSAEGVLSLTPTLVVTTADAGPPAVLAQLRAAGTPLQVLDAKMSPAGVLASVRRLGELCERGTVAAELAARIAVEVQQAQARVAELAARAAGRAAPRVLFVLSHTMSQVRVAGRDTAADAMVTLAGGANAFAAVSGYKPLTPEAAIGAAPDVILSTVQGLHAAGGIDGLLRAPGLAATPAGRARRVVALDALLLLGFGPRLALAVRRLAEALHAPAGARA